jgi:hypothetical protein
LLVIAAGRLLQLILGIDRTILGYSPLWTPTTMRDALLYGEIQSSAIGAGLTTRDDFQRLQIHFFRFNPEGLRRLSVKDQILFQPT